MMREVLRWLVWSCIAFVEWVWCAAVEFVTDDSD